MIKTRYLQEKHIAIFLFIVSVFISAVQFPSLFYRFAPSWIQSNMSQIDAALTWYAHTHSGKYPDSLQELAEWMEKKQGGDWSEGSKSMFVVAPAEMEGDVDQWSDFVLVPGRRKDDPIGTVVVYGGPRCHMKGQTIALLIDHFLYFKWIEVEKLKKVMLTSGIYKE